MSKAYDMAVAREKDWQDLKRLMVKSGSVILIDEHDPIATRSDRKAREVKHENAGK